MTAHPARHDASARSPFAGQYVHELLGLALSAHGPRPLFDDDRWDLRGAQGAPIQVNPGELDWDFTEIPRPYWRVLVREFMVALRAPHHERIARLPWARREPLSLRTCAQRRFFAVAWLRWLAGNGVQYLEEVTQEHCDRWLHQRRGEDAAASSMSNAVTAIKDLACYTELFTADRYPAGFMPWAGKTATQAAEADWAGENKTPPVPRQRDEAGAARRPLPRGNHRSPRCVPGRRTRHSPAEPDKTQNTLRRVHGTAGPLCRARRTAARAGRAFCPGTPESRMGSG